LSFVLSSRARRPRDNLYTLGAKTAQVQQYIMADQSNESRADTTLRAVQNKKQVPEIDFTLHTMEDGTQVSTQERVCKGMIRS
jgi:hypothetical protein